ncbi:retrovirus-related pol polyprotein from transposon TNT 1-94, partial [Tanacetum coccineum]
DYGEIVIKNVELENSVAKLLSENERLCNEINHVKQVFKEQFDSIKKTRVRSKEQRKDIVDIATQIPSATTIVPGMFKLDLEPLAPRLLQNREAHIDYLKYTQEQADILQRIVEQAKVKQPLDSALDFACKHAQRIQELLVYVRDTCPNAINLSAKKVVVTPKNKVKKVRFAEPLTSSSNSKQVESSITSDSNTPVLSSTGLKCSTSKYGSKPTSNKRNDRISHTPSRNMKNKVEAQPRKVNKKNRVVEPICDDNVKHSKLNANSDLNCATCKKSLFDDVHDKCLLDFVKNVNSCAKSAKKHKKQNIWKPTGHVFTEVGFKWKPTGRTFTIVGNSCPLTRITSANVVPPKQATFHSVETQKPKLKVYSRKPKNVKNIGSSKKAKIVESKTANHSEPNPTWGSNATDIPSSSSLVMAGCSDCSLLDLGMTILQELWGMVTISWEMLLSQGYTSYKLNWFGTRRLSHLNFGTINKLAKDGLARGIPRLKFQKDHLCSACALGKSKKSSHQPKAEDINEEKLYLLHMNLCGPMRVASINGKRYILVIVDDYSRFTWVRFSMTKDEAPEAIIKCIKNIQVHLNATVRNVRTDNGTEFVNQTLHEFYEKVGISHQTFVARTPQQNDVVERRNRTLIKVAHTMLIFSKALLFLWAKAINTACYTQNRSIIHRQYNKTPYELIQDKKPDLSFFFHVFGALCYPTNDNDDLGKLDAKADIGIFVGYAPAKKAFRIYNKRTHKIIETIHVSFDELTALASEQFSSGPGLQCMTPATSSSGLVPNHVSQQPFQDVVAPRAVVLADSPVSTSIEQDASSTKSPKTPNFRDDPLNESPHEESTSQGSSSNVRQTHTPFEHLGIWTKDYPIANIIGNPSRSVSMRKQLQTDAMWCYFDAFLTFVEPKNFKQAMTEPSWIDAMQE